MLGISQQALSEATNINIKQIQKYENGSIPMASSVLYFFAKLLKMPVSYFMSEVPLATYNAEYSCDNKNEYITIW
ncbi:MAG: helix-turn-helix transcriptional regulator [Candidatus Rickettsia vulgarisii]